jgi:hypothetical protein
VGEADECRLDKKCALAPATRDRLAQHEHRDRSPGHLHLGGGRLVGAARRARSDFIGGWIADRSLVPRDASSAHITGTLRLGEIAYRRWPGADEHPTTTVLRVLEHDYAGLSVEQAEEAIALSAIAPSAPTYTQQRAAKRSLSKQAIRAVLIPVLEAPDFGSWWIEGSRQQLVDWGLAAGPLDARGQKRVVAEGDLLDDTAAHRRHRDGRNALPTEALRVIASPSLDDALAERETPGSRT